MEVSALPPLFYKIFQVTYVGYLKKKNLFGDEEFLLVELIFYIIWTPNEGFTLDSSRYTVMSALVCQ